MIVTGAPLAIYLLFAAPAAGALLALVPIAGVGRLAARAASLVALAASVGLLVASASGRWGPYIGVDALSDLFLFTVTAIYATSAWYSDRYLRAVHRPFLTPQVYYALLSAFAFTMISALLVTDLGLMWIGIEATTVSSALLIVLERRPTSVEAAWRYTLIASAGLTVALFALLLLYTDTGTLDAIRLAAAPPAATLPVLMAVALALVGYGTKIGLFPMHTWLPDAHSEAPSPISAMFSGVLLPTALYAFLRVYRVLGTAPPSSIRDLLLTFGLVTAVVGAFLLQSQRSYKRMFAYSSMEVMGLALTGVAIGGVALYGALLLIVAHAFVKSAAFYCSGNVLRATGTTRIDDVRDLRTQLPWTGGAWVLSSLGVTGAPPFGTFVGELLIVVGAVEVGADWVAVVVLIAIFLAFVGVNGQVGRMVFGESPAGRSPAAVGTDTGFEIPYLNVGVALALGVASLPYLAPIVRSATVLLGGAVP